MYDPTTGRWNTSDPLAEKHFSWTPYRYAFNNPIRYVDHMGLLEADYFDEDGNYLGNDGVDDGQVRVVQKDLWDLYRNSGSTSSKGERIHPWIGFFLSKPFSEANLPIWAALKIYQHYSFTGATLRHLMNDQNHAGMRIVRDEKWFIVEIRIEGNYRNKWSDNYHIIRNIFAHEERHAFDLAMNANYFLTEEQLEARAVKVQLSHSSYNKIGFYGKGPRTYQESIKEHILKYITPYK